MQFIAGSNRHQTFFSTREDQVRADNLVRLIDAFVDKLDLQKLGFTHSGWINYYEKYTYSNMLDIYAHINFRLVKWCMWKYKKFTGQALRWLKIKWEQKPHLFAHWQQCTWFCYPFKK